MKVVSEVILTLLLFCSCLQQHSKVKLLPVPEETTTEKKLKARNSEFEKEIIQAAENVFVASGYGVSNICMIVGDDGYVMIDKGMLSNLAKEVKAEFQKF